MENMLIRTSGSIAIICLCIFTLLSKLYPVDKVGKKWYYVLYYGILCCGLYSAMAFFHLVMKVIS